MAKNNLFLQHAGIQHPIICGPMYPCSNPELVAAVSNAGGIGIVQPISLTYVHGYEFREGLAYIQSLTDKPIGMNLLIEKGSKKYHQRMQMWLDIALEMNIKFFITSLGKPEWVVDVAHKAGAFVYHDVTEAKWAKKAVDVGADGLIAVNNKAGGHAGNKNYDMLLNELKSFNLPIVCAGGIGDADMYHQALNKGYQAVQMGTRFIASTECSANSYYKQAIINSKESDIVLSERLTGVPVSVINTLYIKNKGLKPNKLESWMLKHARLKYFMRMILALKSLWSLKKSLLDKTGEVDYWQAGKSVDKIDSVLSVGEIIKKFTS
ncbi:Enoyl-[acyl-carrier-protein] reductase [FMN] [hydrothermal vent metagenome]|uniref:Enoyl-[acyl-carrier-protein] reductase [FMN] n=1 Tax=hydrothermal vent metagenome TaxID=652676 RepID=A0A3B0Y4U7_9ZZZZ